MNENKYDNLEHFIAINDCYLMTLYQVVWNLQRTIGQNIIIKGKKKISMYRLNKDFIIN
jgi:hypothetical protein